MLGVKQVVENINWLSELELEIIFEMDRQIRRLWLDSRMDR